MHGLGAMGDVAAPDVVVEMEASSMMQHLKHGLVETELERLNGAEMLKVQMYREVFLGNFF